MLTVPKISKKKLAAYIIVMLIMFFGTAYFLYKNYIMTAPIDNSGIPASDFPGPGNLPGSEEETATSTNKEEPGKEEGAEENPYYISIFDNPKFQSLIDNSASSSSSPVIGKENPFVPD
jgi:hypothetical protein